MKAQKILMALAIMSICFSKYSLAIDDSKTSFATEVISAKDFKYNMELVPKEEASLYSLDLPEEVYINGAERNFNDIFIFNKRGKAIPIDIEKIAPNKSTSQKIFSIPFYKTYKEIKSADDLQVSIATQSRQGESVDIRIAGEKTDGSEIIYIDTTQLEKQIKNQPERQTEKEKNNLSEIILNWDYENSSNNLIFPVILETSDNLTSWRHLLTTNLIDFSNMTSRVVENKIPIYAEHGRFIRIKFPEKERTPVIKNIQGKSIVQKTVRYEKWKNITPVKSDERKNSFEITISDKKHSNRIINGLRIRPKDKNSLYSVKLYSKYSENGSWRYYTRQNIFLLESTSQKIVKDIIPISENNAKYWLVEFENNINNIDVSDFDIFEYRWRPHKITFLAQGEAPYTLAFGENYRKNPTRPGSLQQRIGDLSNSLKISNAIEVQEIIENKLTPPAKPQKSFIEQYKSKILWFVISIFVLGMLYIAVKLAKEIQKEG